MQNQSTISLEQNISQSKISEPAKDSESEIALWTTPAEAEMYEHLAELYAVIKATETLETAFTRDAITPEAYRTECFKLITQFKALRKLTKDYVPDIARFMSDFQLKCKLAYHRLVEVGVPDGIPVTDTRKVVAETVQHYITLMDSLKLKIVAVDQLHPLLENLVDSLNKVSELPPNFEGKTKLLNWLTIFNKMKASDELSEEQVRQMLFDLESSYNAFYKSLN